jgi:hypothetical protein
MAACFYFSEIEIPPIFAAVLFVVLEQFWIARAASNYLTGQFFYYRKKRRNHAKSNTSNAGGIAAFLRLLTGL